MLQAFYFSDFIVVQLQLLQFDTVFQVFYLPDYIPAQVKELVIDLL